MLRILIAAVTVYGYAQPGFDGYRPAFLDKPLQAFSIQINSGAQDGRRALAVFDKARLWHYADAFTARMRAELHASTSKQTDIAECAAGLPP